METTTESKSIFGHLPLKHASKLDFSPVEKYIKAKLGTKAYAQSIELFEKILGLRNSLDFKNLKEIYSDNTKLEDLITKHSLYAQYVTLLDKYMSKDFENGKNEVKCYFEWSNSFNQDKIVKINRPKYELASIYYNLANLYFNSAIHAALSLDKALKEHARKRIANAIWYLESAKSISSNLTNAPQDLSEPFLKGLIHFMKGVSYVILEQIVQGSEAKNKDHSFFKDIAQITKSASISFKHAENCLFEAKLKKDGYKGFYNNLRCLSIYFDLNSLHSMSQYNYTAPSPNYNAVKYFLEMSLKHFDKWSDIKVDTCNQFLVKKCLEHQKQRTEELKNIQSHILGISMNSSIRKHEPIIDVNPLDEEIAGAEPQNLKPDTSLEGSFTFLLSESLYNIKLEYETILFEKQQLIIQFIREFFAEKYKVYNKHKISGLLSIKEKGKEDSKNSYFESLIELLKSYGGVGYFRLQARGLVERKVEIIKRIESLMGSINKATELEQALNGSSLRSNQYSEELIRFEEEVVKNKVIQNFEDSKYYEETYNLIKAFVVEKFTTAGVFYDESDYKLYEEMNSQFKELMVLDSELLKVGDQKTMMQEFMKEYEKLKIGDQNLINFFYSLQSQKGDHTKELSEKTLYLDQESNKIKQHLEEYRLKIKKVDEIGKMISEKRKENQECSFKKVQAIINTLRSLVEIFDEIEKQLTKYFEYSTSLDDFELDLSGFVEELEKRKEQSKVPDPYGIPSVSVSIISSQYPSDEKPPGPEVIEFSSQSMLSSRLTYKTKTVSDRADLLGFNYNSDDTLIVSYMISSRRVSKDTSN